MRNYIKDHLPLTNAILHDLQCLNPLARKSDGGRSAIGGLCNHLRKVTKTDQYCDCVCLEWLLYSTDSAVDSYCDTFKSCFLETRFDFGRHCFLRCSASRTICFALYKYTHYYY